MAKKKEKAKTVLADLLSVKIRCPTLGVVDILATQNIQFDFAESECDLCGGHGHKTIKVDCLCGETHDFCISEW